MAAGPHSASLCLRSVRRTNMCRYSDALIVCVVVCLVVFIVYLLTPLHPTAEPIITGANSPSHTRLREINLRSTNDKFEHFDDDANEYETEVTSPATLQRANVDVTSVDSRLRRVGDRRTIHCTRHSQSVFTTAKSISSVSLLVEFSDYQFYDLRNTVDSILLYTDIELIHEIVVIDDGSTLDYVIEDSERYFRTVPKAKLLRSAAPDRVGSAHARSLAASFATGDILLFVDSTVICSFGWLEPMLDTLRHYPNSLVTPHYDRLRDPVSLDYQPTNITLVTSLSWDLTTRMMLSGAPLIADSPILSPVLRGNVFAVRKTYFTDIGSYDPELSAAVSGSGEHVELSLRTWLCGGMILTVPCSRVGILNIHDPIKVSEPGAVQRIASMWFGSHSAIVVGSFGANTKQTVTVSPGETSRGRRHCDVSGTARDIDWFLAHVATNLIVPSTDAVQFGLLRVKTGRCARLLKSTGRIGLEDCKSHLFTTPTNEMVFELSRDSQLKVIGKCVTVQPNAYLLALDCVGADNHQLWQYSVVSGQLVNSWSRYCATHVTDPDKSAPADRQIAMAQDCNVSQVADSVQFRTWEFLPF